MIFIILLIICIIFWPATLAVLGVLTALFSSGLGQWFLLVFVVGLFCKLTGMSK